MATAVVAAVADQTSGQKSRIAQMPKGKESVPE